MLRMGETETCCFIDVKRPVEIPYTFWFYDLKKDVILL